MAKATAKKKTTILTDESMSFFRKYINNASPVGFETWGQKLWLEYLKPYIDEHYVDPYGTAVGIINAKHDFKVVIEAHAFKTQWRCRSVHFPGAAGFDTWKKRASESRIWMAGYSYTAW